MGRLAGLFLVVMLLSASLSTLPLAFADYAVDHASFPPDLPGDVNYDGKVDAKDVGITSKAFGSYFYTDSWDPRADVNDDGMVDMKDIAPVSRLFGTAYDTSATPIAYSTSFEFNVPNDGDASVWYYFLVRFYVPSSLDGRTFSLVAGKSVDDALRNVRVDTVLKQSGQVGELFNINLGEMQKGYHLLELEYLESIGSGLINFTIKTAQDEYAQMDRFRIYVPNYGDTEVKYTVKTTTYFPGDTFFLGSSASQHLYVDDYIDDVYIDAGLLWQDWMWNMGSYDTLHAWKDGFLYPLGWQTGWHTIKFAYGEKLEYGLLDFQFISWTNQRDKIGKPKLYAVGNLNPANYITIKDGKFMAGSKWKFEADPEFSERYFDGRLRFNASYDDGTVWFNTTIEIGLGKGWAEWALLPATMDDVGITINLTSIYFDSCLLESSEDLPWKWWEIRLEDYTIDFYSYQQLEIIGMEFVPEGESIVNQDLTALDYAGTVLMFVCGVFNQPIGALVGLSIKGIAALTNFKAGQPVCRFIETISEYDHRQLLTKRDLIIEPHELMRYNRSNSDVVFFKLNPAAGLHCGTTKVVIKATVVARYNLYTGMFPPVIYSWCYPIGNIEITIRVPWFLRG